MKTKTQRDPALVKKSGNDYLPLFSAKDVTRDKFIHLRKNLIALGCEQQEALRIAKSLSMRVLNLKSEEGYLQYIMKNTYESCKSILKQGCKSRPIQDLDNPDYSHVQLFSSIYNYEINYFKSKNVKNGIADIGCGDGLFIRLLKDEGIAANGFEIEIKNPHHDVSITKIHDFEDIHQPISYVVLNHVLEHIYEHPNDFLSRLIRHFNSFSEKKLQAVLLSIPMHLCVDAHVASGHRWVCYRGSIPSETKFHIAKEKLKLYNPDEELPILAKKLGYRLIAEKNLGLYVIEREG